MKYIREQKVNAYMTVEAALVMSMVIMVYVFLIDCMIYQYERCVEELEAAGNIVLGVEAEKDAMYETNHVNPTMLLRLQKMLEEKEKEEEKVE